jgi:hypothetical protein
MSDFSALAQQYASELGPKRTAEIIGTLRANQGKDFVNRILWPDKYPVQQNEDGSYSTHRMASAEVGGKNIVFPTLFYNRDQNQLYEAPDPVKEAMTRGDYIEFKSPEEADAFASNHYKAGLGAGYKQQTAEESMFRLLH